VGSFHPAGAVVAVAVQLISGGESLFKTNRWALDFPAPSEHLGEVGLSVGPQFLEESGVNIAKPENIAVTCTVIKPALSPPPATGFHPHNRVNERREEF
jgi:hypothetical protein